MEISHTTAAVVAVRDEVFTTQEQIALGGFLAGYSGLTRDAYALDLRQYVAWCTEHAVPLFGARRSDIECFSRHLETLGRARATIARRLCTITCFATPKRKASSPTHPRCMSVGPASTTSRTRPAWTATRSARCSSPLVFPILVITR
jgi:Phage integrase, N-terminal SAM-like domain